MYNYQDRRSNEFNNLKHISAYADLLVWNESASPPVDDLDRMGRGSERGSLREDIDK